MWLGELLHYNNLPGDTQCAEVLLPHKEWLTGTIAELRNAREKYAPLERYLELAKQDKVELEIKSVPTPHASHSGLIQNQPSIRNALLFCGFFSVAVGINLLTMRKSANPVALPKQMP